MNTRQERVVQSLSSRNPLRRVQLQTDTHELYSLKLLLTQPTVLTPTPFLPLVAPRAPEQNLLPPMPMLRYCRKVRLKYLTMKESRLAHSLPPEDAAELDESVDVVCGVEEREAFGEEGEQHDPC